MCHHWHKSLLLLSQKLQLSYWWVNRSGTLRIKESNWKIGLTVVALVDAAYRWNGVPPGDDELVIVANMVHCFRATYLKLVEIQPSKKIKKIIR